MSAWLHCTKLSYSTHSAKTITVTEAIQVDRAETHRQHGPDCHPLPAQAIDMVTQEEGQWHLKPQVTAANKINNKRQKASLQQQGGTACRI